MLQPCIPLQSWNESCYLQVCLFNQMLFFHCNHYCPASCENYCINNSWSHEAKVEILWSKILILLMRMNWEAWIYLWKCMSTITIMLVHPRPELFFWNLKDSPVVVWCVCLCCMSSKFKIWNKSVSILCITAATAAHINEQSGVSCVRVNNTLIISALLPGNYLQDFIIAHLCLHNFMEFWSSLFINLQKHYFLVSKFLMKIRMCS